MTAELKCPECGNYLDTAMHQLGCQGEQQEPATPLSTERLAYLRDRADCHTAPLISIGITELRALLDLAERMDVIPADGPFEETALGGAYLRWRDAWIAADDDDPLKWRSSGLLVELFALIPDGIMREIHKLVAHEAERVQS